MPINIFLEVTYTYWNNNGDSSSFGWLSWSYFSGDKYSAAAHELPGHAFF